MERIEQQNTKVYMFNALHQYTKPMDRPSGYAEVGFIMAGCTSHLGFPRFLVENHRLYIFNPFQHFYCQ